MKQITIMPGLRKILVDDDNRWDFKENVMAALDPQIQRITFDFEANRGTIERMVPNAAGKVKRTREEITDFTPYEYILEAWAGAWNNEDKWAVREARGESLRAQEAKDTAAAAAAQKKLDDLTGKYKSAKDDMIAKHAAAKAGAVPNGPNQ